MWPASLWQLFLQLAGLIGGMRAVAWTDSMQALVMLTIALFSVVLIVYRGLADLAAFSAPWKQTIPNGLPCRDRERRDILIPIALSG